MIYSSEVATGDRSDFGGAARTSDEGGAERENNMSKYKVLVNFRSAEAWDWNAEVKEFITPPRNGEFIRLGSELNWFRVDMVVHDFSGSGVDLVIYAVDAEMAMTYYGDLTG